MVWCEKERILWCSFLQLNNVSRLSINVFGICQLYQFSVFYNIKCLCTTIYKLKFHNHILHILQYVQDIISLSITILETFENFEIVKKIFKKILYCHKMTLGKALTGSFISVFSLSIEKFSDDL